MNHFREKSCELSRPIVLSKRPHRALLSVAAAFFFLGFVSSPINAATTSALPANTNVAVTAAIASALKQNSLPTSLNPSLTAIAGSNVYALQGSALLKANCDPYNHLTEVAHPQPCFYGSTSAKRTIVIFGDSYVGNWLPALDEVGKRLGYRIAAFEFAGCLTSFLPPTPGYGETPTYVRACNQWHANLPAAVRAVKPVAILAASGTLSFGVAGDEGWTKGLQTAFREMTSSSPSTIRVVISTSPHVPSPAPSCLASYSSSIQKCDLSYRPGLLGTGLFSASLVRDQKSAAAANAKFLPTVQWFCLKGRCPVVVDNMLVYADQDHLTIVYSDYLSKVLQNALVPILNRR